MDTQEDEFRDILRECQALHDARAGSASSGAEYDARHDTFVDWSPPSLWILEECRATMRGRGLTEEELDLLWPIDPYVFLIKSCETKTRLKVVLEVLERRQKDPRYIAMAKEILKR